MAIQKITAQFAQRAANTGKSFTSIPLKNNEVANILYDKNSVDCFITKGDKIVGGRGASGPVPYVANEIYTILNKISNLVEKVDQFKDVTVRNIISNFLK